MAARRKPKEKDGTHGSHHAAFTELQAKLKNAEAREHRFLDKYFPRPLDDSFHADLDFVER